MDELITSTSNPRIRNVAKLIDKASERRQQGLFVIEGFREIAMALRKGFEISQLFICTESGGDKSWKELPIEKNAINQIIKVNSDVFAKIAYRESTGGLVALAKPHLLKINDLQLPDNPLILILESVEKPGNLGAILRTADAAAVDAVVVCDPRTDIYNPNVVRSSLGCIFSIPVATCTTSEAFEFLNKKGIQPYSAALTEKASSYHLTDFSKPSAIVLGTEANGLTTAWIDHTPNIIIPMLGLHDSLNVSIAAAVLAYEARRQRGMKA
jgi:TrmH family RNA methyltransferase